MAAFFAATLWTSRTAGPIDLRYDGGVYFLLGKSLAQGEGYRLLNEPGAPQAVQYPPGLPTWVALHFRTVGKGDDVHTARWLRRTSAVLCIALAVGTFAFASSGAGPVAGLIASLICMAHINTVLLSDMLFAEIPFALSILAVAFAGLKTTREKERTGWWELVGAVGAGVAFLFRTAGLAALVAWPLHAAFQRQWKKAVIRGFSMLVPIAFWQGYVSSVKNSPDYQNPAYAYQRAPYQFYNVTYAENVALIDPFEPELGKVTVSALWDRLRKNLRVMPLALAEAVSSTNGFWKWRVETLDMPAAVGALSPSSIRLPMWIIFGLILCGLIAWALRGNWFPALFVMFSIGLICATPWPGQFARYLSSVTPFLAAALVGGAFALLQLAKKPAGWWLTRGFISIAMVSIIAVQSFALSRIFERRDFDPPLLVPGSGPQRVFYHDAEWARWGEAVRWIASNGRKPGAIATSSPQLAHLWTGRPAVFMPMEIEVERAQTLMDSVPIAYLILDQLEFLDVSKRYAEPVVERFSDHWQEVFSIEGTRVYERKTDV